MAMASITICGRIARDPEMRTTARGTNVCKLTIPVDTGYADNKSTTWWTATLFGKSAESASKYLRKGSWVSVAGDAQVRTYEKRDGSTGVSAEVENARWAFAGPKQDGDNQSDNRPTRSGSLSRDEYNAAVAGPDIPF